MRTVHLAVSIRYNIDIYRHLSTQCKTPDFFGKIGLCRYLPSQVYNLIWPENPYSTLLETLYLGVASTKKSSDTFVSGLLFFERENRTRESLCEKKSCLWQVFRTERRRCYAPSHKYASGLPPQTVVLLASTNTNKDELAIVYTVAGFSLYHTSNKETIANYSDGFLFNVNLQIHLLIISSRYSGNLQPPDYRHRVL